jgi:hypothetical protein
VVKTGPHARKAKLVGLKGGWEYEFLVKAVNRHGVGQPGRTATTHFIHQAA